MSAVKFFTFVCLLSKEGEDIAKAIVTNIQKLINFAHFVRAAEPKVTILK